MKFSSLNTDLNKMYSFFRPLQRSLLFLAGLFLFSPFQVSAKLHEKEDGNYFFIQDERAPNEISETTSLYLNNHLVKIFRLDLAHNQINEKISLPDQITGEKTNYTLCGEITLLENGHIKTHLVSNEGVLYSPRNHHYDAVAAENFHNFFLIDYDDPDASQSFERDSTLCPFASS